VAIRQWTYTHNSTVYEYYNSRFAAIGFAFHREEDALCRSGMHRQPWTGGGRSRQPSANEARDTAQMSAHLNDPPFAFPDRAGNYEGRQGHFLFPRRPKAGEIGPAVGCHPWDLRERRKVAFPSQRPSCIDLRTPETTRSDGRTHGECANTGSHPPVE
jgi:hypothetical protein